MFVKINTDGVFGRDTEDTSAQGRVFISCGQTTNEERTLGEQIARLVRDRTGLEGYFAQNQGSLDGVTVNIFQALHNASGFVGIMHRRDKLQKGDFRGSVWVEQEIGIAAFMVQALGLPLPTKAYVQRGIVREGVRGFVLLNPVEFETSQDILDDLDSWWPSLLLPGRVPQPGSGLTLEGELAIIEAAKRHYHQSGTVQPYLQELDSLSTTDKRRMHQKLMNVIRREQGRQPKVYSAEQLAEKYPDAG